MIWGCNEAYSYETLYFCNAYKILLEQINYNIEFLEGLLLALLILITEIMAMKIMYIYRSRPIYYVDQFSIIAVS